MTTPTPDETGFITSTSSEYDESGLTGYLAGYVVFYDYWLRVEEGKFFTSACIR